MTASAPLVPFSARARTSPARIRAQGVDGAVHQRRSAVMHVVVMGLALRESRTALGEARLYSAMNVLVDAPARAAGAARPVPGVAVQGGHVGGGTCSLAPRAAT